MDYKSRNEKIAFLQSLGIEYKDHPDYSLDEIYTLGLMKDLVKDATSCFGSHDNNSSVCTECYMSSQGNCQLLTRYLKDIDPTTSQSTMVIVHQHTEFGDKMTFEVLTAQLNKLNIKPSTKTYKIALVILSSNNCDFNSIITKIMEILGTKTDVKKATLRFYIVRKKLEEATGLKIDIVTHKTLMISKE